MIQIEFGNLVTPLVIMVLCVLPMSVILFLAYKIAKIRFKKPKYARFRYKYTLWYLIFLKSTILVPIVWWVFDTNAKMSFGFSIPFGIWELFIVWIIWCAIIFVYRKLFRKFFRKNQNGTHRKSPTPFYNDKK